MATTSHIIYNYHQLRVFPLENHVGSNGRYPHEMKYAQHLTESFTVMFVLQWFFFHIYSV